MTVVNRKQKQCLDLESLTQHESLEMYIYKSVYVFTSLLFTDLLSLAIKAEHAHKDV